MVLENFERFTQQGRSFNPKISIRKRGQIGFNNGAIKRFKIDGFDYVVLFIDKERTQIAFQFTNNKDEEGARKLAKRKNNYFVSGKSFLDYYNLSYEESQVFSVEWMEEHGIAVINLQEHSTAEVGSQEDDVLS
ncbi:hypothetical protein HN903_02660 [archaeon]|jgi:hypothetical protein|nr:hypothetical protein [archaeon]MBT7128634.1 hypothetical protein [archaeon]